MNAPLTTIPPASRARRRRRWLAPLAVAVGLVALLGGVWWYLDWSEERDFQDAIAETDRLDPGWRLADILAARPAIPYERNSWKHAAKVCGMIQGSGSLGAGLEMQLFKGPLNVQLPREAVEALREHLEPLRIARNEAHKLKDMPDGQGDLDYEATADSASHDWLRHLPELARFVRLDTTMRSHQGNRVEIAESCRAQLNVARATGGDLTVYALLVRIDALEIALENLERVLAQHELPADALRALQQLLQREIDEPSLVWWTRGERAFDMNMMEAVRSGKVRLPPMNRAKGGSWYARIINNSLPGALTNHCGSYLRAWNQLVEASKLPVDRQLDEFERIRQYCERQDANVASLKFFCSVFIGEHAPVQARLHCALTAVAIERYRQAHRFWPTSLGAVVDAGYLKAVPIDLYDGQPLRYSALADGVLVYSVGADRVDNGGVLNRANPIAAGADIGFQLWDLDKRGHPSAPPE